MTVLWARLTPEQMKEDVYFDWKPLQPYRKVFYTQEAALAAASGPAVEVFLAGTAVCAVLCRRRKPWRWPAFDWVRLLLGVLGALLLVPLYLAVWLFLFGLAFEGLHWSHAFVLPMGVLMASSPLIIGCVLQWWQYKTTRPAEALQGEISRRLRGLTLVAVLVMTALAGAAVYLPIHKLPPGRRAPQASIRHRRKPDV
jgi:hypothetical protein